MGNPTNEENWASRERLRTVERALWWRGWVGRPDITGLFGISAAQASGDLQRYLELNPGSMVYHTSRKRYEAAPGSRWIFGEPSFEEGLAVFFGGGTAVYPAPDQESDRVSGVGLPSRKGDPAITRCLTMAALASRFVRVEYLSVSSGKSGWRIIAPHAFGHDGYRWHVRSWCEENEGYRDFVLSRMRNIEWPGEQTGELPPDEDWNRFETVVLQPHEKLSAPARRAIETDYGIRAGGKLKLRVRTAMKGYLLAHLRVDREGLPRHFDLLE